ncbi:MAG TPA: serine/threonine protein kinase, partial [Deltaproteobacteria bacterium]|nr:serine/threonine protein kinase [Deltaproteobacteria bacterium]
TRRSNLRSRFEREAATMALLDHPNVIRVYDVVSDEPLPFMVMELAEGGTLIEWLNAYGGMPAGLACQVLEQVARGLGAAHAVGVVHRDVKPHNVLITLLGQCKLTDFGIARIRDSDTGEGMTRTGSTMGTIGYMAPEQRSDAKYVDQRADIYSLGALLYKLLTGGIVTDLFLVEHEPQLLADVPGPLHELILKACFHDRERRYPDTDALLQTLAELRPLLDPDPDDTPPLPIPLSERPPDPESSPFPEIQLLFGESPRALSPRPSPDRVLPYRMPAPRPAPDPAGIYPSYVDPGEAERGDLILDSLPPARREAFSPASSVSPHRTARALDPTGPGPRRRPTKTLVLAALALAAWLLFVITGASGAWSVHSAQGRALATQDHLYSLLINEQGLLSELRRLGLAPDTTHELHALYLSFEEADSEPARFRAATAYVKALRVRSDPLLLKASPGSLAKVRAQQIERVFGDAIVAQQQWFRRARSTPGRLAIGLGLAPAP